MQLFTVQMSRWRQLKDRNIELVDTTVKSGERFLAPTWEIVLSHKDGRISDAEYTAVYLDLMRRSYVAHQDQWLRLIRTDGPIAIACYCSYMVDGKRKFCHRHLLKDMLDKVCQANGVDFTFYGEYR